MHVTAQIIDDTKQQTVAYSTSTAAKAPKTTMIDKAVWVGEDIAKKAKAKKVTKVAFDRGGQAYHGRVKALAEAARKAGLEF
jgi:large subunit ribosomal protein L18